MGRKYKKWDSMSRKINRKICEKGNFVDYIELLAAQHLHFFAETSQRINYQLKVSRRTEDMKTKGDVHKIIRRFYPGQTNSLYEWSGDKWGAEA
jgi:hypothetical protein